MKTVFITITRGLLTRNILRNQFFTKLASDNDVRVILFFSQMRKKVPPASLKKEFEKENVIVEYAPNNEVGIVRKIFFAAIRNLVFSPTTKMYAKYGTPKVQRKNFIYNIILNIIYTPLSKIYFLKVLVRLIETYIFKDSEYEIYFKKYNPDLVFASALLSNFDLAFLKNARRRGIRTVSMPKSWDNLDKILFRFEPDLFLVQNEWMLRDAERYQGFSVDRISVVGFPQFDIYQDNTKLVDREEYCRAHGFNQFLPIIFIGSEGFWSPGDEKIFEKIVDARDSQLIPSCNILVRPHFSTIDDDRYKFLRERMNVYIDDRYTRSDFFVDKWNPSEADMEDFSNTLHHCAVSINFASTLSLDAACFDKPIINIAFGIRFTKGKRGIKDATPVIYKTGFYQEVIKTQATTVVYDYNELFESIKMYLNSPKIKNKERAALRRRLCYKVDGRSGQRLYEFIKSML